MHVYMCKLTYEYDNDGKATDALVGLNGMDDNNQFTDSQLKLINSDLPDGQTFDTINNQDLIKLARQKLVNYILGK